jgi:FG-GAP-like repeat
MLARILVAAFLVPAAVAQDFPVPAAPVPYPSDTLTGADLNGDGRVDLICTADSAFAGDPDVSVTLSQAGGAWSAPVEYDTGRRARDAAAGLINGDGLLDVAVCHSMGQKVVVLRGLGGGALGPPLNYFVGGNLREIELGDLDGDGALDLVCFADTDGGEVRVNLADGTGGFLAATAFAAGGTGPYLRLGDLDGDGFLDAGIAHATQQSLATLLNDGSGALAAPVPYQLSGNHTPNSLALADVTGDGWLDTLVSHALPPAIELFAGDGAGGGALLPPTGIDPGAHAQGLVVADVDGDTRPDIVTGNQFGFPTPFAPGAVVVVLNLGGGAFAPPQAFHPGYSNGALLVADATGDGFADILSQWDPGFAAILRGDGAGGFESVRLLGVETPSLVEAADLDDDGAPDLLVAAGGSHDVAVLLADGGGGWLPPQATPSLGYPVEARAADVDGDGALDVLVGDAPPLTIYRGDGDGGLLPPVGVTVPGGSVGQIEPCDVDADGDLDVLATLFVGSQFPSRVQVLLGNGLGGFAAGASVPVGFAASDIDAGDLDGNGAPDAVTANSDSGSISIVLSDGRGGLLPATSLPTGILARSVALTDLDQDGALDAAVVHLGTTGIVRLLGDGAGGLGSAVTFPAGSLLRVTAGDFDGDGAQDIAATGTFLPLAVWPGDGAGGLQTPRRFQTGREPAGIAAADLDGDARPDLLAACSSLTAGAGCIAVLDNLTDPYIWADLGFALAGAQGEPALIGSGALLPGTPGSLALQHAHPLALAVLFVAATSQPQPFKGGTLVPVPPALQLTVVTDLVGTLEIGWQAWPSSSPGEDWYFQYGIADPAAVHGVALSNALRATEP